MCEVLGAGVPPGGAEGRLPRPLVIARLEKLICYSRSPAARGAGYPLPTLPSECRPHVPD